MTYIDASEFTPDPKLGRPEFKTTAGPWGSKEMTWVLWQ